MDTDLVIEMLDNFHDSRVIERIDERVHIGIDHPAGKKQRLVMILDIGMSSVKLMKILDAFRDIELYIIPGYMDRLPKQTFIINSGYTVFYNGDMRHVFSKIKKRCPQLDVLAKKFPREIALTIISYYRPSSDYEAYQWALTCDDEPLFTSSPTIFFRHGCVSPLECRFLKIPILIPQRLAIDICTYLSLGLTLKRENVSEPVYVVDDHIPYILLRNRSAGYDKIATIRICRRGSLAGTIYSSGLIISRDSFAVAEIFDIGIGIIPFMLHGDKVEYCYDQPDLTEELPCKRFVPDWYYSYIKSGLTRAVPYILPEKYVVVDDKFLCNRELYDRASIARLRYIRDMVDGFLNHGLSLPGDTEDTKYSKNPIADYFDNPTKYTTEPLSEAIDINFAFDDY